MFSTMAVRSDNTTIATTWNAVNRRVFETPRQKWSSRQELGSTNDPQSNR